MNEIQKTIEVLKDMKWHYVHKRPRSVFYQYVLTLGACIHNNKKITFPYEIPMIGIDYHLALGQKEWDNLNILVQKEIETKNTFLVDLMTDSYDLNKKIEEFCIDLEAKDLKKMSNEDLIGTWNTYLAMLYEVGAYVIFPLFAEKYLETKLKAEIQKNFKADETENVFQILTTPIKAGVIQQEELSLLKMAIKKSKNEDIEGDISRHLRELSWIKNNKFDGSFYSRDEILERIDVLAKSDPEKKLKE